MENVAEHGSEDDQPPVVLVGAILLSAETYSRRQNGMHEHMAEVAERAFADGSHVLRMIIADSGADTAARLALSPGGPGSGSGTGRIRQETILKPSVCNRLRSAGTTAGESEQLGSAG